MKKNDRPSEHFIGAILRAYDTEKATGQNPIRPAHLWDRVVIECLHTPHGFEVMFQWDTSKAQNINRIGTIMDCIERGYVPGLKLVTNAKGWIAVEET